MSSASFRRLSTSTPPDLRNGVVAIGNFDGVHRGHQVVLDRALEQAARLSVPALVLTFEPHPRLLFQPDVPHFVLTPPPMKAALLDALGFDAVVEYPFTREFSGLSAEAFVTDILRGALGVGHVVCGFDFHFGKSRQGGPAYLLASSEEHGFGATLVDAFRDEGANVISSSRIRDLLREGEVAEANGLLGYRYTVEAEISRGQQLGRTLNYPTANMVLGPQMELRHGVYAVRFRRADGSLYDGVASFGLRPTVTDSGEPLLETFLFDFDGDLYGEICRVSFFGFLRPELKFTDLDALTIQMKRDEAEARALLSSVQPLSELDAQIAF